MYAHQSYKLGISELRLQLEFDSLHPYSYDYTMMFGIVFFFPSYFLFLAGQGMMELTNTDICDSI